MWFGKAVPFYGRNLLSAYSGYKLEVTGTSETLVPKFVVCEVYSLQYKECDTAGKAPHIRTVLYLRLGGGERGTISVPCSINERAILKVKLSILLIYVIEGDG